MHSVSDGTHRSVHLEWVASCGPETQFLTPGCWDAETRHNEAPLLSPLLCRVSGMGQKGRNHLSDHAAWPQASHKALTFPRYPFSPMSCICCIVSLFCSTFSLCPLSAVVVVAFHGLQEKEHNRHQERCPGAPTHSFSAHFWARGGQRAMICTENAYGRGVSLQLPHSIAFTQGTLMN